MSQTCVMRGWPPRRRTVQPLAPPARRRGPTGSPPPRPRGATDPPPPPPRGGGPPPGTHKRAPGTTPPAPPPPPPPPGAAGGGAGLVAPGVLPVDAVRGIRSGRRSNRRRPGRRPSPGGRPNPRRWAWPEGPSRSALRQRVRVWGERLLSADDTWRARLARSRRAGGCTQCCLAARPSASATGESDCRARTARDVIVLRDRGAPAAAPDAAVRRCPQPARLRALARRARSIPDPRRQRPGRRGAGGAKDR